MLIYFDIHTSLIKPQKGNVQIPIPSINTFIPYIDWYLPCKYKLYAMTKQ